MLTKTLSLARNRPDARDDAPAAASRRTAVRSAAHVPSRRRSSERSIRRRQRRAGTRPKSTSAVEWKTAPRDRCRSTVQPVLRAVATARNGMTMKFARPRDTQMSESTCPKSIASAYRNRSSPNIPARPAASGLIDPARLRVHAPDQLLDEDQPEYGQAEPQQVAGARPECRRRLGRKRVAEQYARNQNRADSNERIARSDRTGRGRVGRTHEAGEECEPCAIAQRIGEVRRRETSAATQRGPSRATTPPTARWRPVRRSAAGRAGSRELRSRPARQTPGIRRAASP